MATSPTTYARYSKNCKERIEERKSKRKKLMTVTAVAAVALEECFIRSPEEGGRESDEREVQCVPPMIFLACLEVPAKRPSRRRFIEPPRRITRTSMLVTRRPS